VKEVCIFLLIGVGLKIVLTVEGIRRSDCFDKKLGDWGELLMIW